VIEKRNQLIHRLLNERLLAIEVGIVTNGELERVEREHLNVQRVIQIMPSLESSIE
jgi:hypothetical protein